MHKLACKDTGISPTCNFEASGETLDEVVEQGMEHARSAHGEELAATGTGEADTRAAISAKVTEDDGEGEAEAE